MKGRRYTTVVVILPEKTMRSNVTRHKGFRKRCSSALALTNATTLSKSNRPTVHHVHTQDNISVRKHGNVQTEPS